MACVGLSPVPQEVALAFRFDRTGALSGTKTVDLEELRLLGTGAAEIAPVVPELRERPSEIPPVTEDASANARFRPFDNVTRFLENTTSAASVLALIPDDLHGADRTPLLLLQFVARHLRDVAHLIVGVLTCSKYRHRSYAALEGGGVGLKRSFRPGGAEPTSVPRIRCGPIRGLRRHRRLR
jgi:hypothetical protein